MKKRLAFCIPTYNRSDVLEETLGHMLPRLDKEVCDFFIYDSSGNDSSCECVREYIKKYSNVFYVRVGSDVHSNAKVYQIFQDIVDGDSYEYVWMCADAYTWSQNVIDSVQKLMEHKYDMIILNHRDVEKLGTKEIIDEKELFRDCAWIMTLYGATIIRTDTILKGIAWEDLKNRYLIPERINHSHVALYFESLAGMQAFKAIHVSVSANDFSSSNKKERPGWTDRTFEVWCQYWPSMIHELPTCYDDDKDLVIKKIGTNSVEFKPYNLISLRLADIYNEAVFRKYIRRWGKITDTPFWKLAFIAYFPKSWIPLFDSDYYRRIEYPYRRIRSFCKGCEEIYIYGCGSVAKRVYMMLQENGQEVSAFITSGGSSGEEYFMGKRILSMSSNLLAHKGLGIILALNKGNTEEVLESIAGFSEKQECRVICAVDGKKYKKRE